MKNCKELIKEFKLRFGEEPRIFRSPGRINIIGEHVDYHDGFVMPAAINREIVLLISPSTNSSTIYAQDLGENVHFSIQDLSRVSEPWAFYILGVIEQFKKRGASLRNMNILFSGNIPAGAGMSSSAAIECATAFALNEIFHLNFSKLDLIKMAQKAEHEFVGVKCGIMDQFASMMSTSHGALKLDCRDLTYEPVDIDLDKYHFLFVDSSVKHSLASSEYNVRRKECDQALEIIKKRFPDISSLRDMSLSQLEPCKNELSEKLYNRCEFVIQEINRVNEASDAFNNKDLNKLGNLLYQSHEGLQYKYEVSCEELDFLVDFTRDREEVLGARMMGGGFGGCSINLIAKDSIDKFSKDISTAFEQAYGMRPQIYDVELAQGTSEIVQ